MKGSNTFTSPGNYGTLGVPSPTNEPPARYEGAEWTDLQGTFWLFGGLISGSLSELNDLWKYDISTNMWTWVSGSNIPSPGNYGVQGVPSALNTPGARAWGVVTWIDVNGDLWLYGGLGYATSNFNYGWLDDLWRYNIATNEWTWMSGTNIECTTTDPGVFGTIGVSSASNRPPARAETSCSWTVNNNLWMFGGQVMSGGGWGSASNDLWKYDINTNEWTWMSGSSTPNQPPNWGVKGLSSPTNVPGARFAYTRWKDNCDNLWLFGGFSLDTYSYYNDVWKYDINTNEWTWMSGTNIADDPGTPGTKCVPSTNICPAARSETRSCWTDDHGNVYIFGGAYYFNMTSFAYNDLWYFNSATLEWTFVSGSLTPNLPNNSGTINVSSPTNMPGERSGSNSWRDNNGNLWLFGGISSTNIGVVYHYYNDLWRFVPDPTCPSVPQLIVNLGTDTALCSPFSLTLNANNPGCSYQWSTGATSQTIVINTTGAYAVTVTDPNCQTDRDTINVTFSQTLNVDLGNDTVLCQSVSLMLNAGNPGSTYLWSTNETSQTIQVTSPGKYWVSVSDQNCNNTDTIVVSVIYPPDLGVDISMCKQNQIVLDAGASAGNYLWSTGENTQIIVVTQPGKYWVQISKANCSTSDTIVVNKGGSVTMYFPNTFTPDGDGLNDIFTGYGEDIEMFNMKIFNRWGEMIFETDDFSKGWDGKYKGNPIQSDIYVWVADFKTSCSGEKIRHEIGRVFVFR
jgi:gliding motility-associated-like protein